MDQRDVRTNDVGSSASAVNDNTDDALSTRRTGARPDAACNLPAAVDGTADAAGHAPTHAEPAEEEDEINEIVWQTAEGAVEVPNVAIPETSEYASESARNESNIADDEILSTVSTGHSSAGHHVRMVRLAPHSLAGIIQAAKAASTADSSDRNGGLTDMEKLRDAAEVVRRVVKSKQTGPAAVNAVRRVVELLSEKFEALYSSWADPLVEPKDMFRRNRQCNDEWRLIADYVEKKLFGLHDDDDDIEDPENSTVHILMDHFIRPTTVPDDLRVMSLVLMCMLAHMQEFAWDELLDDDTYGNQNSFQWLLDIVSMCRNSRNADMSLYSRWLLLEYMTPKNNSESKVSEEQFLTPATALIPEIIRTLTEEIAAHLQNASAANGAASSAHAAAVSGKHRPLFASEQFTVRLTELPVLHSSPPTPSVTGPMARGLREASPDASSNSSWAEWERLHVGEYGTNFPVYPSSTSVRLRVNLQLLGAFFDYRGKTFQRELAGEDVLSPLISILKHHTRFHVRIVVHAIKTIALALRIHRFAMRFVSSDAAAAAASDTVVERPLLYMKTIARNSFHYYALAGIWNALVRHPSVYEIILRFPHDSLQQLIQFTLSCIESGHLNVVRNASEIFFQIIRAKVFVDLFDGQDGVRRLMNIVSTSRLIHEVIETTNMQNVFSDQRHGAADSDDENQRDMHAVIGVAASPRTSGVVGPAGPSSATSNQQQHSSGSSLSKEEKNDAIKIIAEIAAMLSQYLFCDLSIRAERVRFDLARRQVLSRTDFPKFCATIATHKVVSEYPQGEPMEELAEFIQLFAAHVKTPSSITKLCLYDGVATLTRFVAVAEKLTETSGGSKQMPDILHNVMAVLTYMLMFSAGKRRFTEPLPDAMRMFMHGVPNYLSFYANYLHHDVDHDGQLRVPGDLELSAAHLFTNAIYVPSVQSISSSSGLHTQSSSSADLNTGAAAVQHRLTPPNMLLSSVSSRAAQQHTGHPFGRVLSGHDLVDQVDMPTEKLIRQMRQIDFLEKILVFLDIIHPNVDTQQERAYYEIKRLSIKLLAGMARLPEVAQILAHLPMGSGEKLKVVASEKPFFNENEKERRRLQAAARHLMAIIARYRRDLMDSVRKADIIARTKIDFNQEQLMEVIGSYLRQCGFDNSARALQLEMAQKQQFSGFGGAGGTGGGTPLLPPRPSRRMLHAAATAEPNNDAALSDDVIQPSLFLSPSSFDSEHNNNVRQQQNSRENVDDEGLISPVRKRARFNNVNHQSDDAVPNNVEIAAYQPSTDASSRMQQQQIMPFSGQQLSRRHRNAVVGGTPVPRTIATASARRRRPVNWNASASSATQQALISTRQPRVTLDEIVKHYFRAEHSQCPYPTVACPPFSFFKRHHCPAPPRLTAGVPRSITLVNMERERSLANIHTTYDVLRRNEMREQALRCVFGKFRHENDITLGTGPDEDDISGFLAATYSYDGESVLFSTDYGEMIQFSRRGGSSGTDWRQVGSPHQCGHPEVQDYDGCSISWMEYSPIPQERQILLTHCQSGVSLWRVRDGDFERLQHKWHLPGYTYPRLSPLASSNMVMMTSEPSQSVAYLFDIETQQQLYRLHDEFVACNYERNRPVFHPFEDGLVLNDGVLWDLRMSKPLHKFDPFQRAISGVFHPNGRHAIISSEVWDLRTFKLMRSVPSIRECELKFNITGDILYGMPLAHESASEDRSPSYMTSFHTLSGSTFDTLATVTARHEYYDLVLDYYDKQVLLLESGEEAGHIISPTVAKFYQVGLTKPPPEEVGDNVYDSDEADDDDDEDDDDNDDDDDDSDNADDDDDDSSRYGWGSPSTTDTSSPSESVTLSPSSTNPDAANEDAADIGDYIVEFEEPDAEDDVSENEDDEEEDEDDDDDEDVSSSYHPSTDEDNSSVVELSPAQRDAQNEMDVDDENQAVDEDYTGYADSSTTISGGDAEVQIISANAGPNSNATPLSSHQSESSGMNEVDSSVTNDSIDNDGSGMPLRRSTRRRMSGRAAAAAIQQQAVLQEAVEEELSLSPAQYQSTHPYSLRRRSRL